MTATRMPLANAVIYATFQHVGVAQQQKVHQTLRESDLVQAVKFLLEVEDGVVCDTGIMREQAIRRLRDAFEEFKR